MSSIRAFAQKVEALNIDTALQTAFTANEREIADQNRKQLYAGFDKKGQRLKKYRNSKYARVKNQMNPVPGLGNPDFFLTGAFQRAISVQVQGGTIRTLMNDSKSDDLLKRDPDIIGLGGEFKKELIDTKLRPAFLAEVKKSLKI